MTRRALVVGAAGFVGRHVVTRLLHERWRVAAALTPKRIAPSAWDQHVEVFRLSGVDEADCRRAVGNARFDIVVNLAAYGVAPGDRDPRAAQQVNVDLAAALARFAATRGAGLVQAGSCAEYAPSSTSLIDEVSALTAARLYGASKAAGGLLALATASAVGAPMRLLRLFNVYGPGEAEHRLLPTLAAARLGPERVALSAGQQTRDFVHVDDVASGIVRAAERIATGEIRDARAINLCTGAATSVRDFALVAARALGIDPARLGFGDLALRPDDLPRVVGDPKAMFADLDWRPALDLEDGLAAAARSMIEGDAA